MPGSSTLGKLYLLPTIIRFSKRERIDRILDIGPGLGTYVDMLRPYFPKAHFTAIEAWGPYIKKFALETKYDRVIAADARYFNYADLGKIDCAITGDVLEHMSFADAHLLLDNLVKISRIAALSVPIGHAPQGEEEGNPFEVHVEADYTLDMVRQFPDVVELVQDGWVGIAFLSRDAAARPILSEAFEWASAIAPQVVAEFGQPTDWDYAALAERLRVIFNDQSPEIDEATALSAESATVTPPESDRPLVPLTDAMTWTNTLGTPNDERYIDKIIRYKGINYLAIPLNDPIEIQKRGADFEYEAITKRIVRDEWLYLSTLRLLMPKMYDAKLENVSVQRMNDSDPFWNNGYLPETEARALYGMMAHLAPRLTIEIGAGNSTKFFRKAIRDFELPTRLCAIAPVRHAEVQGIADEVLATSVLAVDLELFDQLEARDILFCDGSHIVFNGSDVTRLFLEIIPRLKPGVVVHLHDIFLPFEAAPNSEVGDVSLPEQYMLGAFLLNNHAAKVLLPLHYLSRRKLAPGPAGSFWFVAG